MGRLKTDTWERMLEQMEQEEWEKNCAEGNYPNLLHAGKGCIHAGFCHG